METSSPALGRVSFVASAANVYAGSSQLPPSCFSLSSIMQLSLESKRCHHPQRETGSLTVSAWSSVPWKSQPTCSVSEGCLQITRCHKVTTMVYFVQIQEFIFIFFKKINFLITLICEYIDVYLCVWCVPQHTCGRHKTPLRNLFSPATLWGLRKELRSSGLCRSTSTH